MYPPEAGNFYNFRPCFLVFATKNDASSKDFLEIFCMFRNFLYVQKFFWGLAHLRIFLYTQNKNFLVFQKRKKNTLVPAIDTTD